MSERLGSTIPMEPSFESVQSGAGSAFRDWGQTSEYHWFVGPPRPPRFFIPDSDDVIIAPTRKNYLSETEQSINGIRNVRRVFPETSIAVPVTDPRTAEMFASELLDLGVEIGIHDDLADGNPIGLDPHNLFGRDGKIRYQLDVREGKRSPSDPSRMEWTDEYVNDAIRELDKQDAAFYKIFGRHPSFRAPHLNLFRHHGAKNAYETHAAQIAEKRGTPARQRPPEGVLTPPIPTNDVSLDGVNNVIILPGHIVNATDSIPEWGIGSLGAHFGRPELGYQWQTAQFANPRLREKIEAAGVSIIPWSRVPQIAADRLRAKGRIDKATVSGHEAYGMAG